MALSSLVAPACSLLSCLCLGALLLVKSDQGVCFIFLSFFKHSQDIVVRTPRCHSVFQSKPKFVSDLTLAYVRGSETERSLQRNEWMAFFWLLLVLWNCPELFSWCFFWLCKNVCSPHRGPVAPVLFPAVHQLAFFDGFTGIETGIPLFLMFC